MENTDLIYFSPTGNCKKTAEAIAERLRETACAVKDITPFKERGAEGFAIDGNFIVVSPIYAHGLIEEVVEYLKKCGISKDGGAVFVCCYGNVAYGGAVKEIAGICAKLGINLKAVIMLPSAHGYSGKGVKDAVLYEREKTLDAVTEFIDGIFCGRDISRSAVCGYKKLPSNVKPAEPDYKFKKFLGDITVRIVKSDGCIKCGKCVKECPAGAISNDIIIDGSKCLRCARCVKICPRGALEIKFQLSFAKLYINSRVAKPKKAVIYYNF